MPNCPQEVSHIIGILSALKIQSIDLSSDISSVSFFIFYYEKNMFEYIKFDRGKKTTTK